MDPVAGFSKSVNVALACFFLLARLLLPLTMLQCALVRDTSSSKHARAKQHD